MGSITLPKRGPVFIDAQIAIYSVEKHYYYEPHLRALWQQVQARSLTVLCSEICLIEAIVLPLRNRDSTLVGEFESFFRQLGLQLLPVSLTVLREAAQLRAELPKLRTPDAIHAASALLARADIFLTNDVQLRMLPNLQVTVLQEAIQGQP
jgi:predicted nucleic acid-binding protein